MSLIEVVERGPEWADDAVIPGWSERITARGFRAVSLTTEADPQKRGAGWLAEQRKKFTSEAAFRREFQIDWNAGEGDPFWPEWFENGGRAAYVRPLPYIIEGPVYRGWDFGRRHPACVWFQYSRAQHRLLILRSVTGTGIGIHNFRDLVMYLSGQRPVSQLHGQEALSALDAIENDPLQPPTPWFAPNIERPLHFIDFGGAEATHDSDMVKEETLAKTRADVLEEEGIYLTQVSAHRERVTLMRRMLEIHPDGLPRTIIDPSNELLISGFAGGITFKPPTPEDRLPVGYRKDGVHDHVWEALGYGIVAVVPLNLTKAQTTRVSYPDRLRVEETEEVSGFGFNESRAPAATNGW